MAKDMVRGMQKGCWCLGACRHRGAGPALGKASPCMDQVEQGEIRSFCLSLAAGQPASWIPLLLPADGENSILLSRIRGAGDRK